MRIVQQQQCWRFNAKSSNSVKLILDDCAQGVQNTVASSLHSPLQAETGLASLPKSHFDQPALRRKDLVR